MSESSVNENKQTSTEIDLSYWIESWQENRIGFHRQEVSKLFQTHLLPKLISSKQPKYVLFPLCGKTVEMKAVLDTGHRVIGIEGCQTGVEAFFNENNIPYEIKNDETNQYQVYKGTDHPVTIYCGDFLNFNQTLPTIDYIWDRGSLVAIGPSTREQYRDIISRLMTPDLTQLFLVAINYDDPDFTAPPHIVSDDEVNRLFGSNCSSQLIEVRDETEEFNSRLVTKRVKYIEERLHIIIKNQN